RASMAIGCAREVARRVLKSARMNERRRTRFSTRLEVAYHVFDARGGELDIGRLTRARTGDVGDGGLFLARVALPMGTRLHFYLSLDGNRTVEGFGVVAHERPRFDAWAGETPGVGVRFTWLGRDARARLDQFLDERRAIDRAAMQAALSRARA